MANRTTRSISNGDLVSLDRNGKPNGMNGKSPKKPNRKHMKSNITNKVRARHAAVATGEDDGQNEDADEDSSAIEEQTGTKEPAVSTLSGVTEDVVREDEMRLAGYTSNEEHNLNETIPADDEQAQAGAERVPEVAADDGYGGIEDENDTDESDEEDDEQSILRSAERDLIDEFERTEQKRDASLMTIDMHGMAIDDNDAIKPHVNLQTPAFELEGFELDVNMNEDPFFGLTRNDNLYNDMWTEAESEIWRMPETVRQHHNNETNGTQKRVRFEEIRSRASSTTGSEEDPNEAFPDLFTDSEDPALKRRLALAADSGLDLLQYNDDDAGSFYDFEDEDEKFAFEVDENSDSEYGSSDYDSEDEGDTTDEETAEEQIARLEERKKAAGKTADRSPSTPSMANRRVSTTDSAPSTPRPTIPKQGKGPVAGTFVIDPTRATMTTDARGRKIKLLPPSQPQERDKAFWDRARTANSTRTNSPSESAYLTLPSPAGDNMPLEPFTAKSTLGSMFNGNLDILRNNDSSGIAEDLFPAMMPGRQTSFTTTTTDESDADLQDVNMQDFIDMRGSDSDSDEPPSSSLTSPSEPGMSRSLSGSGFLEHLNQCRGVVGAFRQNQHQAKHFSSLASHPAKRASAHEYNALQKGKRGAANTPITPARRNRASQDLSTNSAGIRKTISSPLNSRRPRSRGNSLIGMSNADLLQTLSRNPFE